ncbi:hypothetical protein PAXRUDRAFT_133306 [Paxillus rubicundulus Ve08.2h10]|uniref:Uncharacterized protein n=1 Tax=Paxillus rubicundulus Ve08.2h10 TaxID=930991 RepID=A0A0D0EC71_9AGAM|nr:hypothetical protein PAXRUDRAFT_133306 [Paxillus rubicundulus Ve08.2h10]
MLNPAPTNSVPPSITIPIRTRQVSTDSKDSKKKAANFFGLFRTKSGSSKPLDPPVASTTTRVSIDNQRVHTDTPSTAVPAATPVPQKVTPSSAAKESKERTPALQPAVSAHAGAQPKPKSKVVDPIIIPPSQKQATREHRDTAPHNFTPFKFLTMHSKRNRTMSAASLDVCDGNTATNTVIGSPEHSVVQAQPLPPIIPPAVRDPLIATTQWRDREEAERRERKKNRIRRPGVTFDVEEEPPSPVPGTTGKRKKLVRRSSGRTPTSGPARS